MYGLRQKKIIMAFLCTALTVFITEGLFSQEAGVPSDKVRGTRIEYTSAGLKDPFEEPEIEIEKTSDLDMQPLPNLTVQGLVWGSSIPQAIINNKVFRVGDNIEGAEVVEIGRDGVILARGSGKYKLSSPAAINSEKSQSTLPEGGADEQKF